MMFSKLNKEFIGARKQGEKKLVEVLSFLKAGVLKEAIDKRLDRENIVNSVIYQTAAKQIKMNLESLETIKDEVKKETLEFANEVLKGYLPENISKEKMLELIKANESIIKNPNQLIGIITKYCKEHDLGVDVEDVKNTIKEYFK
jgi:uncharacterized protein YqeY